MIIRQLLLRQGSRIAQSRTPALRRSYAAQSAEGIEKLLHNALQQTHQIEAEVQAATMNVVTQISDDIHAPQETAAPPSVASLYAQHRHDRQRTGTLGTEVSRGYVPYELLKQPPAPGEVTLEMLMAAEAHLGHATGLWNPLNSRWIHGIRHGIHIIGLEHTATHLRRASRVVEGVAEAAGLVLFVGTRKGQWQIVVEAARRAGGYYVFDRWRPGTITNPGPMLRTAELQAVDPLDRPIAGFEEELTERAPLVPDLVVCLNPKDNYPLLHECGLANVPSIGLIDTDADPTWVTYPIPANDDSLRTAQLIAGTLAVASQTGQKRRLARARQGKMAYPPIDMESLRIVDAS